MKTKKQEAEIALLTSNWHKRNPWFCKDYHRTIYVMWLQTEAEKYGKAFVGTSAYFRYIDKKMREAFPSMRKKLKKKK